MLYGARCRDLSMPRDSRGIEVCSSTAMLYGARCMSLSMVRDSRGIEVCSSTAMLYGARCRGLHVSGFRGIDVCSSTAMLYGARCMGLSMPRDSVVLRLVLAQRCFMVLGAWISPCFGIPWY
ncbi:hypothetical protein FKM82_028767 [Ascaphus truei]